MRHSKLLLAIPAVLALAACGQNRQEAANDGAVTTSTDGAMTTEGTMAADGAMATDGTMATGGANVPGAGGMAPGEGATPTDSMANPGIPGGDLNAGAGNSNTGPGNDGSAGTLPTGGNTDAPPR